MDIVQIVKEHPVPIIGAAVILALLMMRGGGGNGASAAYGASLQSQALANDANVKLSSISAQESAARAGYAATMYQAGIAAQVAGKNADVAVLSHFFDHLDAQTSFADDLEAKQASINAGAALGAKSLETQLQMHLDDNATKLNGLSQTLQSANYAIDKQAGTTLSLANLTAANLPTILHSQETVAQIQAANAQQLAVINGQTAQTIASINTDAARTTAQAQKNQSDWGIVGDIGSAIASFFAF